MMISVWNFFAEYEGAPYIRFGRLYTPPLLLNTGKLSNIKTFLV